MAAIINPRKVAIVGCGFVGSASAFALMQSGLFAEMVLIDVDRDRAEGAALDIAHGMPFASPMNIYAGDYTDIDDAAITVITYLMGMAVRASRMDNKWIPILCGLLGGLLGLVSFYLLPIPDYPAGDPITAAAVGIVSGLAATGLHQAAKQLSKEAGGDA